MAPAPIDVVRAQFEAYRAGDLAAAQQLVTDDLRFTSPLDDAIDREAFLERCFPTASLFVRQEVTALIPIDRDTVLLRYVAQRDGAPPFSNVELMTVQDGRISEIRVYFGGTDVFPDDSA